MEIVNTCFGETVSSVIASMPDLDELLTFRKCVRKYARVKMRCINYYHNGLHKEDQQDYLYQSLKRMHDI